MPLRTDLPMARAGLTSPPSPGVVSRARTAPVAARPITPGAAATRLPDWQRDRLLDLADETRDEPECWT